MICPKAIKADPDFYIQYFLADVRRLTYGTYFIIASLYNYHSFVNYAIWKIKNSNVCVCVCVSVRLYTIFLKKLLADFDETWQDDV